MISLSSLEEVKITTGISFSFGSPRQYCGSVGKVENSQVGVFVGYSGPKGYGLISTQLFMLEKWFGEDYAQLRKGCAVPDELTFQTKPQIALDLIHKIEQSGLFKAKWIGMDCLYGNIATSSKPVIF